MKAAADAAPPQPAPAGAEIAVDGNFVGDTPRELAVAAGVLTITISKHGYKPWGRKLKEGHGSCRTGAVRARADSLRSWRSSLAESVLSLRNKDGVHGRDPYINGSPSPVTSALSSAPVLDHSPRVLRAHRRNHAFHWPSDLCPSALCAFHARVAFRRSTTCSSTAHGAFNRQ